MDRELAPEIIRKQRFKGWGVALVALLVLGGSYYVLSKVLRTNLNQSEVRVVVAETGNVENTLTASGEVIPAFEALFADDFGCEFTIHFFGSFVRVKAKGVPKLSY